MEANGKSVRFNCILCVVVVILMVTVSFIFDKTIITEENENVVTASLMDIEPQPHTVGVTTPSSISSYQTATSGAVETATSSSITAKEKRQKEEMRKKKIKEQRRKKRLQLKRAKRKRLEQKRKAQQRRIGKAKSYSYTYRELMTLSKVIYEEARGEKHKGKVAVGAVAFNRLKTKSAEFGAENGKLIEVLLKKWAFAEITISDKEFKSSPYYEDCVSAAKEALEGVDPTKEYFPNGALFFYDITMDISPKQMKYREGIDTYKIGCHAFHVELND